MARPSADLRILDPRPTLQGSGDPNSLQNLIVDQLPNGAVCYVNGEADWFVLDKFDTAAASPPNVIVTGRGASKPGRWHRYSGVGIAAQYVPNFSYLRAHPALINAGACFVLSHTNPGDGGFGDFYWDAASTAADNNGTIIQVTGVVTGRWTREYDGPIEASWFGMAPAASGATNLAAWNAALALAAAGPIAGSIHVSGGTYDFSAGFTLGPANCGLTIIGEGVQGGSQGGPGFLGTGTRFRLVNAAAVFVHFQATNTSISSIWFDGGELADDVIQFNYLTVNCHWFNCLFSGATPTTGNIHNYAGAIEIDDMSFQRCTLQESRISGATRAAYLVFVNNNSNVFQSDYTECYFAGGLTLFRFSQGSVNVRDSHMFNWTNQCILVDAACNAFHFRDCYNETDTAPFFNCVLTAGVQSSGSITFENLILHGATDIIHIGTQPLILKNVQTRGNIYSIPAATYGIHRITSHDTAFSGGDWAGVGYPGNVDEWDTSWTTALGKTRTRFASPTIHWNLSGTNTNPALSPVSYDLNGLSLAIEKGVPSTTTVLSDLHDIQTLTQDRTYPLSISGTLQANLIEVTRQNATDGFTAIVNGIALNRNGPIIGARWAYDIGGGWLLVEICCSPIAQMGAMSLTDTALANNASTAVLAQTLAGLGASKKYIGTLGFRTVIYETASKPDSGSMDVVVDLYITTNGGGVATVALQTTPFADTSRLPASISTSTTTVAPSAGGFTISATRPAGIACAASCEWWITKLKDIT